MRAPLAACCEPAGKLWQLCKVLYVSEHKTQYLLIHAPFTRIVVFWHIGNVPPMISESQICCSTATFCVATIFVKIAIQPAVGYNSLANLRSLSCSPLGKFFFWNGTIVCYLMAPIHYLNQCWLNINEIPWYSPKRNLTVGIQFIPYNEFENYTFEIISTSSSGH